MKEGFGKNIFQGDKTIWFIYIGLLFISCIEVYSASSSLIYGKVYQGDYVGPILKHMAMCAIGLFVAIAIHMVDIRQYKNIFLVGGAVCLIVLTATPFIGHAENGASRWIGVGPIQLQPSEIMKVFFISILAYGLSKIEENENEKRTMMVLIGFVFFVCLIIVIENGSMAVLYYFVAMLMFIMGKVKWKYILYPCLFCAIAGGSVIAFTRTDVGKEIKVLHRFQTINARIDRFTSNDEEATTRIDKNSPHGVVPIINDENLQASHGKIAIANSYGIGRGPGRSKEQEVLPQAYSDFIFAIIIEELGLEGGLVVLLLYMLLLYRCGKIIAISHYKYSALIVTGLVMFISLQALINTGVAVGVLPVTGQPLPVISRGGTSGIMFGIYFGILLSISRCEELEDKKSPNQPKTEAEAAQEARNA